jgi:hypothetical protein
MSECTHRPRGVTRLRFFWGMVALRHVEHLCLFGFVSLAYISASPLVSRPYPLT